MSKIGLFLDTGNLYHSVKNTYAAKIDYKAIMDFVSDIGRVEVAIAYGADHGSGAGAFKTRLMELGYHPCFKKTTVERGVNNNVEIALDIAKYADQLDTIVLGTGDGALASALEAVDCNIMILGCNISTSLVGTKIEIPRSLLL
jgi:uncharacterized LabA/DUF88 family protein